MDRSFFQGIALARGVRERRFAVAVVICLLALASTPASAKAPSEVVIQGVGVPYALRLTDPSVVLSFLDLTTGAGQETPAAGTSLAYRYIVSLLLPGESLEQPGWRFFLEPGSVSTQAYVFSVRTGVSIVGGEETYVWTTLFHPPGLDDLMAPYAMLGVGEAQYVVGESPPDVPPPLEIRDVGSVGSTSPVLWIVAIGAAVFLTGLIMHLPKRLRSH